jgi:SAM-dependent methyltransferase
VGADATRDVDWYVELAEAAREPIVELARRVGPRGDEIARRTSKRVIGVDLSPKMLAVARCGRRLPLDLREGDARDLVLDAQVELVICPFRSMLHLPTWHDRRRVFDRVAASLVPGGRFAWNVFAFSASLATALDGQRVEREGGRWEIATNVPADSRIDITRGRGLERIGTFSLWWATRREWEGLIDVAGLEARGPRRLPSEPYDDDSLEQVWVAQACCAHAADRQARGVKPSSS